MPPVRRHLFSPELTAAGAGNGQYHSTPYRPVRPRDGYSTTTSHKRSVPDSRNYASDSEDPLSWLEAQRAKLVDKREGRSQSTQRSQEKRLMSEFAGRLDASGTKSSSGTGAQSDTEDNRVVGRYGRGRSYGHKEPSLSLSAAPCSYDSLDEINKLLSMEESSSSKDVRTASGEESWQTRTLQHGKGNNFGRSHSTSNNYESGANFYVSGIERPAFSTHQTKYVFCVSPSPSRMMNEGGPPTVCTSPPIPQRGNSSKDAVSRTHSRNRTGEFFNCKTNFPTVFKSVISSLLLFSYSVNFIV